MLGKVQLGTFELGAPPPEGGSSTSYAFGQAQADIKATTNKFAQAQADILHTYQSYGQCQADIKHTYQVYAQGQAQIINTYQAFGQSQAQIIVFGVNRFSQVQADILHTYQGYSQSQADIKAVGFGFAQAQAQIINTYQAYGQAQGDIKATSNGYSQSQGDIKQTYNGFAQAQSDIKTMYQVYAQCQAQIILIQRGYAQAQGYVKTTNNACGQAQGYIYILGRDYGQSQALIISAPHFYGLGQSNADIKSISRKFAQVNSLIDSSIKVYSGNSQGYILKSAGYGQAAALIHLNKVWAQSQAQIKRVQLTRGWGQALALITNKKKQGQAQAWIKNTKVQGYGQARASINRHFAWGQAQARLVSFTTYRFAQTQARTKQTYTQFAQAQALIYIKGTQFAQTQAYINGRGIRFGQVNADILTKYNAYAQATVNIIGNTGYGQALGLITGGTLGFIVEDILSNAHTYSFPMGLDGSVPVDLNGYGNDTYIDPDQMFGGSVDGSWALSFNWNTPPLSPEEVAPDGWFYFTLPETALVHLDTWKRPLPYTAFDVDPDTIIELWAGDSGPGNWIPLGANDDSTNYFNLIVDEFPESIYQSILEVILSPGTYLVQLGVYGVSNRVVRKDFDLHVTVIKPQTYGNAQASISQPHPRQYGQAQAIINTRFNMAQAQAKINAFGTQKFAQAQGRIRLSYGTGQAQAYIINFSSFIIEDLLGNAHTYLLIPGHAGTVYVDLSTYGSDATNADPVFSGQFPPDASWDNNYSDLPTKEAPNGWIYFTLPSAMYVNLDTYTFYDRTHDTVLGLYTGVSGPGAWEVIVGQDDSDIFETYESEIFQFLPAGTYLLQVGIYAYSVEDHPDKAFINLHVSTYSPVGLGQAQASIRPRVLDIEGIGQANATINQPSPRQYAQAQTLINHTQGFAQTQATIKAFNWNVFGLAMARIRLFPFNAANPYQRLVVEDGAEAYYTLGEPLLPGGMTLGSPYESSIMLYKDRVWDNIDLLDLERTNGTSGSGPYGGATVGDYSSTITIPSLSSYYGESLGIPGAKAPSGILSADEIITGPNELRQLTTSVSYLPLFRRDWTIEFWYKALQFSAVEDTIMLIGNTNPNASGAISIVYSSGNIRMFLGQGGSKLPGPVLSGIILNQWYHIVYTNDGDTATRLWVNGAQEDASFTIFHHTVDTFVIHPYSTIGAIFILDQIALYAYEIDPETIPVHYLAGIELNVKTGMAMAYIRPNVKTGQALAEIFNPWAKGMAQALINITPHKVAQAQAYIKGYNTGQAQAYILTGKRGFGLANANISAPLKRFGQAQAKITNKYPTGMAQAVIQTANYFVSFNGYQLPGYVQEETIDSVEKINTFGPAFRDISFSEYMGLENKNLTLRILVMGENYLDCKNQIELAGTLVRTKKKGFAPLYVQYYDRHFDALTKSIQTTGTTSNIKTSEYTVDFECKPWLESDQEVTLTGTTLIQTTGRDLDDGGWTPATLQFSGTNVTVSGYTATGDFTGFISVSGTVTDMIVNTEDYTATINGQNANAYMNSLDYQTHVGPGVTNFAITGATSVTIKYHNRWYL